MSYTYSQVPSDVTSDYGTQRDNGRVSFWSHLTFGWVCQGIYNADRERPLEELEFGPAARQVNARNITESLRARWYSDVENAVSSEGTPKLWKSTFKVSDSTDLWFCLLLVTCARILQPVLFFAVLQVLVSDFEGSKLWLCGVGVAMWLTFVLEAVINDYFAYAVKTVSASTRTALTGLMYEKVLSMKETDLAKSLSDHLIDKMSRRLKLVEYCPSLLPYLFIGPLEFILHSVLLGLLVDWAALTGVAYLFVCALLRCGLGRVFLKLRWCTVFFSSKRLRLFDDVIQGIRAIKMNMWEDLFTGFVSEARRRELRVLSRKVGILAGFLSVQDGLPIISLFVSMTTLLLTNHTLNPGIIFTTLLILSILKSSCMERLPSAVNSLLQTLQVFEDIEEFLLSVPDGAQSTVRRSSNAAAPLQSVTLVQAGCLERADFEYENPPDYSNVAPSRANPPAYVESVEAPLRARAQIVSGTRARSSSERSRRRSLSMFDVSCEQTTVPLLQQFTGLTNVTFNCVEGEIIAITGRSGAGKSALLESIAGELPLSRGRVYVRGRVAYVTQKPWLFKGTLRENILFGDPFDDRKYTEVVEVCALAPDFDDLALGDMSIVGAPDVILSVGQQARLSLARALYSDAEVYLLDEPLAHIGSNTAEYIFMRCIMGKLSRRTCIMVTKCQKYLEEMSRILLLVDGVCVRDCDYRSFIDSGEDLSWLRKNGNNPEGDAGENYRSVYDILQQETRLEDLPVTSVTRRVYGDYVTAGTHWLVLVLIGGILLLLPNGIVTVLGFWVTWMADRWRETQYQISTVITSTALIGALVLALFLRALFFLQAGLRSSKNLHDHLLSVVLRAPIEVVNEKAPDLVRTFSKDVETVDETIPRALVQLLCSLTNSFLAALVVVIAAPWSILAVLPTFVLLLCVVNYTFPVVQELTRLEAIALKAVNGHFADTCLGLVNIRSYEKQDFIWNKLYSYQDRYNLAFLSRTGADQWIAIRFQAIVSLLGLFVVIMDILVLDEALLALSLPFVRELVVGVALIPVSLTRLEKHMSCAAEILKFLEIKPEPGYNSPTLPPEGWPERGRIEFENVSFKYHRGGDAILKNISFEIEAGMKIACIGRTGAGKSSLVSALFRMPEPKGHVFIDGILLSELNLREARSAMFVATRDPFLFSGSVRRNLDPHRRYIDRDLWDALAQVRMKTAIEELPGQLNYYVTNQGNIFEPYERQLLGFARALLQDKKIVILDGVDLESHFKTSRIIETMLKTKFQDRTVISLVHGAVSLDTILCQDMVAVLDCGRLTEYDSPQAMLSREGSYLVYLWNHYRSAPPQERRVRFSRTSVSN